MTNSFAPNKKLNNQKGISLVELVMVLASIFVLTLLITNLPNSLSAITESRNMSIADNVAVSKMETLRQTVYSDNLTNGLVYFKDPSLSQLSEAIATYDIEDCPVSICTNGENLKQIEVKITWNQSGNLKKIDLMTLVAQGGLGQ